jgi:hypothetical protein
VSSEFEKKNSGSSHMNFNVKTQQQFRKRNKGNYETQSKFTNVSQSFKFKQEGDTSTIKNLSERIQIAKNEIKEIYEKSRFNSSIVDFPLLDEYNSFQKGIKNRTIYPKLKTHVNNMMKLNEIFAHQIPNERHSNFIKTLPRFKSISNKVELNSKSRTSSMTNFAKFAFFLAQKEMEPPSQKDIIEKLLRDPSTKKMIEEALKNKENKVIYSNEIHGNYEVINRKSTIKTVDPNSKLSLKSERTKEMITESLIDAKSFDDFMNQKDGEVDDPTGLFNVLKGIQQRKCSCGYLCIEIGTIYGDWDSLRPKNVIVQTKEYEDVNLILKPVIIINNIPSNGGNNNTKNGGNNNNTISGYKVKIIEEEDCGDFDLLKSAGMLHFKEKIKPVIQRKFYRKVQIGDKNYANDIFKQGLNIILIERNKDYTKGK